MAAMLRVAARIVSAEHSVLRSAAIHGTACCGIQHDAESTGRTTAPQQLTSLHDFAGHPPAAHLPGGSASAFTCFSGAPCTHSTNVSGAGAAQQQLCRSFSSAADKSSGLGTSPASVVETDARVCWQCGATVPRVSFFFCVQCNVIQPAVPTADLFLLLDVPPGFDVDQVRLEASYKQLQRRLHPDKYSTASLEERAFSEEQSALVSTAYATLRQPLKRAIYLLERGGVLEAGTGGEGMVADDPLLLARVMEVREQIEDAKDDAELQQLREENTAHQAQQLKALSAAFAAGDLNAALDMTVRLKYTDRIREAVEKRAAA